jgi:hypothetical protein
VAYAYVKAEDHPTGKRAAKVAGIIEQIVEADGDAVPFEEACANVDVTVPQHRANLLVAMHALELAGVVDRYTYVETGSTRGKPAYALADGVAIEEGDD